MKLLIRLLFPLIICVCLCSCTEDSDDEGSDDGGNNGGSTLATDACGEIGLSTRIIDGSACRDGRSAVVQILLVSPVGDVGSCSGTMLTNQYVLSAAHCAAGNVAGNVIINGNQEVISEVTIHPNYEASALGGDDFPGYDVAIFKLARSVETPTLPLLLSTDVKKNDTISIFGFGQDNKGEIGTLRSGQMKISDKRDTLLLAEFSDEVGGSNTCFGDSGGPALYSSLVDNQVRRGVVGVTSFGVRPDCQRGDTSGFANIQNDSLRDFVLSVVPNAVVR
jgi:hypothetical protein